MKRLSTRSSPRKKASKAHATDRAVLARNAIIAPRRPGKLSPTNRLVSLRLNDEIHGEIRIEQRSYRVKIADLKSGQSR